METQKIITYSAIGVAGIVCLVFLLDLAFAIFHRNIAMDIMFIIGSGLPSLAGRRDHSRAPLIAAELAREDRARRRLVIARVLRPHVRRAPGPGHPTCIPSLRPRRSNRVTEQPRLSPG